MDNNNIMKYIPIALALAASLSSCAETTKPVPDRFDDTSRAPGHATDLMNQAYGAGSQQTLDLFLPAAVSTKTPVLIMLHGGAWTMGGKQYTDQSARDLRDSGFVVANVDYRYVSDAVHATDLLEDIDEAVQFVEGLAVKYQYAPQGYHLSGISAGAHLALLYCYQSTRRFRSVTALCAPTRLDDPKALAFLSANNLVRNVERLAGAKYERNGSNRAFTEVSPYAFAKSLPTLLIHGDADPLVPVDQSKELYALLQQKSIESRLLIMPGKGHDVGMNQPDSERKILGEISQWIRMH